MNRITTYIRVRYRVGSMLVLIVLFVLTGCRETTVPENAAVRHKAASAHPSVVELVLPSENAVADSLVKTIVSAAGLSEASLYRWKNHYFIFAVMEQTGAFQASLSKALPDATVRSYPDFFYAFERSRCTGGDTAVYNGEWDHLLLAASLVSDTTLQNEYMNAHATQFEKWPEVAQGFCRAQFQQLLLYRKDDQLVLIISIPAGKSLDELNPLTTKDNPRVDEWNRQMSKYQQGIPGTDSSEVWVFPAVLK